MKKGNDDLKAKIAKIQQKGKAPAPIPAPAVSDQAPEEEAEPSMEALEAEFEAKKQALLQKAKAETAKKVPAQEPEADGQDQNPEGLDQAINEYSDQGKFNVEVIFQLVQINRNLKSIADSLASLINNGDQ